MHFCTCGNRLRFEYVLYLKTKDGKMILPIWPETRLLVVYCTRCGVRMTFKEFVATGYSIM
jgi:hypothetical protein